MTFFILHVILQKLEYLSFEREKQVQGLKRIGVVEGWQSQSVYKSNSILK
jgi:hypothetical protein